MLYHTNSAARRLTPSKSAPSAQGAAPKPVARPGATGAAPRRPQQVKPLTPAQRLDICASGLRAGFDGRQRLYGAPTSEAVRLWYSAYDLAAQQRREQLAAQADPLAAALGWRVRPLEIDARW